MNELLGRSSKRRHNDRDGLSLEHDDNRTCAATKLPVRISRGAAGLGTWTPKHRRDAATRDFPKRDDHANETNKKLAEAIQPHEHCSRK